MTTPTPTVDCELLRANARAMAADVLAVLDTTRLARFAAARANKAARAAAEEPARARTQTPLASTYATSSHLSSLAEGYEWAAEQVQRTAEEAMR